VPSKNEKEFISSKKKTSIALPGARTGKHK
jgi:hypothetical protein